MTSRIAAHDGRFMFLVGMGFMSLALLFGGGSRLDLFGPIVVRLIAVGVLVWLMLRSRGMLDDVPAHAKWFGFMLLALPVVQLVPLPWALWTMLPGRSLAVEMFDALGLHPWQMISLTPERTLNSLLALLVPFAAFFIGWTMDGATRYKVLTGITVFTVGSAALGIMQVVAGSDSLLHFYNVTNADASVGLFSNANHHALFLSAGIVLILWWMGEKLATSRRLPTEQIAIGALGLIVILFSLAMTFSRAGVLLGSSALFIGLAILSTNVSGANRTKLWLVAGIVGLVAGAVFYATIFEKVFGDAQAAGMAGDGRIANVPLFLRIAWEYFPFGGGLGGFDPIYQGYEPVAEISLTYLNNAHNEPAQILIEGGLLGSVLMVLFCLWWAVRTCQIWFMSDAKGVYLPQQKVASAAIGLAMVHSLVDYPLRTASLSAVFAICVVIMLKPSGPHLLKSGIWQK